MYKRWIKILPLFLILLTAVIWMAENGTEYLEALTHKKHEFFAVRVREGTGEEIECWKSPYEAPYYLFLPSYGNQDECYICLNSGDTLRIDFSSNLQEGAVVKFSVDSYEGKELASKEYSVSGENIYAEFAVDPEWEGVLYATVQCSPQVGSQPSEVTDLYGNYFQNIDGEHVIWNDKSNIFLVQSEKINLG